MGGTSSQLLSGTLTMAWTNQEVAVNSPLKAAALLLQVLHFHSGCPVLENGLFHHILSG